METSSRFDLCVIGAGLVGSAAARHASANPSIKVCLVGPEEPQEGETNREIFGSHYDEGRITRVLDENVACEILSRHSINRYRELEKLSGIHFYEPLGTLFIGHKNSDFMSHLVQSSCIGKVPLVKLAQKDLKIRYPFITMREDEYAFLDENGAGHISPRNMVAAQKKVAILQGCHYFKEIVHHVTHFKENGLYTVVTDKRRIEANRVLICTGAFTNFKNLLTVSHKEPKLDIRKELVALLPLSESESKKLSTMPSLIYQRPGKVERCGAYILPPIKYPDGKTYIKIGYTDMQCSEQALTLEEIKNWYTLKRKNHDLTNLMVLFLDVLPGVTVNENIKADTCVTCNTPSGLPYINRVTPTLTLAVGGNGKMAKFSDEVGRIASHLSITGRWDSELGEEMFNILWQDRKLNKSSEFKLPFSL